MKRKAVLEEEYLSSLSDDEPENDDMIATEFSWKRRNEYVSTQLDIMSKLICASDRVLDNAFSMKLEIKAHNVYAQIESLLETETMEPMVKTWPDSLGSQEMVTISECILARDGCVEDYDLKSVGKRASTLYQQLYGRRPRKTMRYFNSEPVAVNIYSKAASERTIEVVLDELE